MCKSTRLANVIDTSPTDFSYCSTFRKIGLNITKQDFLGVSVANTADDQREVGFDARIDFNGRIGPQHCYK